MSASPDSLSPTLERTDVTRAVDEFLSSFLAVPIDELHDSMCFNAVASWDSLGHAELMTGLAEILAGGLAAGAEGFLLSVGAIREYARTGRVVRSDEMAAGHVFRRGLRGVAYAETVICEIDERGHELRYCSIPVEDLTGKDFVETVHLLIWGTPGGPTALRKTKNHIWRGSQMAHESEGQLGADLLASIAMGPRPEGASLEETAFMCVGHVIGLVGRHLVQAPRPNSSDMEMQWARYLLGADRVAAFGDAAVRLLNACLVLQAEHGSNASTFVSRIVAACGGGA